MKAAIEKSPHIADVVGMKCKKEESGAHVYINITVYYVSCHGRLWIYE